LKSNSEASGSGANGTSERGLGADAVRRIRLIGTAAGCLIIVALILVDASRLRDQVFDLYQRLLPRHVDATPAIVVEIDERSLARIGGWPWPRTYLADLVNRITERGALAIGFDMIFPETDRYSPTRFAELYGDPPPDLAAHFRSLPDPDDVLQSAISRAPVVLSRAGVADHEHEGIVDPDELMLMTDFIGPTPSKVITFPGVIGNIEILDGSAAGLASINGPAEPDGVIRRLPMVVRIGEQLTPALSVELLRVASGTDEFTMTVRNGDLISLKIADRVVPTGSDGRIRPHFSQPYQSRTISAADVLLDRVPIDAFDRKIVIIGLAAIGLKDVVSTPVAAKSYGSDLHAQAIETILAGSWLKRPESMATIEIGMAMTLAVLAILVLPRFRPNRAVLCVGCGIILISVASFGAFAGWRLLLDLVAPLTGGGGTALVCLAALLGETDRHRRYLRASLEEERIQAAKYAGELAAAKDIQFGMLPSAASLSALPDQVRLRAFLEPARGVGGDLFDAFMLDETRLYFMVGDVTGKGVPASLFMALAKALSKSVLLREGHDLERAVMDANAEISRENSAEFFVTALLGVLDIETGRVELCNAGHENPLIVDLDGSIRVFEMDGGPPLCAFEDFPYPVEPMTLKRGETLVILTDGVTEAQSPDGALFGRDRLFDVLTEKRNGDVVEELVGAVRRFESGAEPTDDLTIMTVGYTGSDV
jgi:adenylate cyclase